MDLEHSEKLLMHLPGHIHIWLHHLLKWDLTLLTYMGYKRWEQKVITSVMLYQINQPIIQLMEFIQMDIGM